MKRLKNNETELLNIPFFEDTPKEEIKKLLPYFETLEYKDKELIIEEGATDTNVFFVLDGEVKIESYGPNGEAFRYRNRPTGKHFGDFAIFSGKPRAANIYATGQTKLAKLKGEIYLDFILEHKNLAKAVFKRLAQLIYAASARVKSHIIMNPEQRIAKEIIKLAKEEKTKTLIKKFPTESELAAKVDMARETTSRALNKLIKKNIIKRSLNKQLIIIDYEKLKEIIEAAN